jgi:hypothetical protein
MHSAATQLLCMKTRNRPRVRQVSPTRARWRTGAAIAPAEEISDLKIEQPALTKFEFGQAPLSRMRESAAAREACNDLADLPSSAFGTFSRRGEKGNSITSSL